MYSTEQQQVMKGTNALAKQCCSSVWTPAEATFYS